MPSCSFHTLAIDDDVSPDGSPDVSPVGRLDDNCQPAAGSMSARSLGFLATLDHRRQQQPPTMKAYGSMPSHSTLVGPHSLPVPPYDLPLKSGQIRTCQDDERDVLQAYANVTTTMVTLTELHPTSLDDGRRTTDDGRSAVRHVPCRAATCSTVFLPTTLLKPWYHTAIQPAHGAFPTCTPDVERARAAKTSRLAPRASRPAPRAPLPSGSAAPRPTAQEIIATPWSARAALY